MAHTNSSDMAVESYFIDEITVNNTPVNNDEQQDSLLRSNVRPSTLDNSDLQASTSESLSAAVASSETPEPIPSSSTPAYRYI